MGQYPILIGGVESNIGIHQTSTTPFHLPGTRAEMSDGRVFRYARSDGTGCAAGNLLVGPTPATANHVNANVLAAPIGSTQVTITLGATSATQNQYTGGYFWVNDGTGEGHLYRVVSHPASAGSEDIAIQLADPIAVALVASGTSQCSLVMNPYNGVVIAGAGAASMVVGAAPVALAASAYGWVQTRGLASVLASTTGPVAGDPAMTGADGTTTVVTAAADLVVGIYHWAETASGDQCLVWLEID